MSDTPANTSGGAPLASVDLVNSEKDRGLVRTLARSGKRWGITEEVRTQVVSDLVLASKTARETIIYADPKAGCDVLTSVAKTFAALDKLNQADEHLADKNERLDSGKATELVHTAAVIALPAEVAKGPL